MPRKNGATVAPQQATGIPQLTKLPCSHAQRKGGLSYAVLVHAKENEAQQTATKKVHPGALPWAIFHRLPTSVLTDPGFDNGKAEDTLMLAAGQGHLKMA
jgi:hypothetical protein